MGQVPAKFMMPSAPYGASQATSVLNQAQPQPTNPQTPLLPPTFTDPGRMGGGMATQNLPQNPMNPTNPQAPRFGGGGYGNPMRSLYGQ